MKQFHAVPFALLLGVLMVLWGAGFIGYGFARWDAPDATRWALVLFGFLVVCYGVAITRKAFVI